ncbi:phosphoglycolate phosphatase [Rubritalea halochordaticola]|uniref:phosphoglycolate phosphatase n=1 Tax=Rubritalea halochordaticola TaxID=714537 RepID=A0ABP9UWZ8_9BACT
MHIIFDLDGTLVESLPGIAAALNAASAETGLPTHSDAAVRSFIGDGARMLCKRSAPDQSEDTIDKLQASFAAHYSREWKTGTLVFQGIEPLLAELKTLGHSLSILSNKPHHFTTEIVEHFFPGEIFDLILGQREHIEKKPDPSGVHEILQSIGCSPADAILVGDSTVDLITARNAGISSLAVTWGYHDLDQLQAESPSHTADSVSMLHSILTSELTTTLS